MPWRLGSGLKGNQGWNDGVGSGLAGFGHQTQKADVAIPLEEFDLQCVIRDFVSDVLAQQLA